MQHQECSALWEFHIPAEPKPLGRRHQRWHHRTDPAAGTVKESDCGNKNIAVSASRDGIDVGTRRRGTRNPDLLPPGCGLGQCDQGVKRSKTLNFDDTLIGPSANRHDRWNTPVEHYPRVHFRQVITTFWMLCNVKLFAGQLRPLLLWRPRQRRIQCAATQHAQNKQQPWR